MAKQVKQFRYYGDENRANNWPQGLSMRQLISGSAFTSCIPILQLGIQALPGTEFYLNNPDDSNPIIIGNTGIYELDLSGLSEIISLRFRQKSLQLISENKNAHLIIDIIYEDGEN